MPARLTTPRRSTNVKWATGFLVAAVAVFVFYQYIYPDLNGNAQTFFRDWLPITAVNEALIFVIMALGLNIVVGYAGLLDLGYVAFWAIGGYTGGWLMSAFIDKVNIHVGGTAPSTLRGVHITFWAVLLIAGLFCALMGIIIGAPTLRLKSDYLAIVTLGFGEIIPQFFSNGNNIFGHNITNGPQGILPVDAIGTGPFQAVPGVHSSLGPFDAPYRFVIFCAARGVLRLRVPAHPHRPPGPGVAGDPRGRAGREHDGRSADAHQAGRLRRGCLLRRRRGVAFATHINGVIADRFNFSISVIILAMVVLGGMGNVWGVILGALALAWINSTGMIQFGNSFNNAFGTHVDFPSKTFLLFGAILVLMMLFRREGLVPETRTRAVLREPERGQLESVGADMEGGQDDVDASPATRRRWRRS